MADTWSLIDLERPIFQLGSKVARFRRCTWAAPLWSGGSLRSWGLHSLMARERCLCTWAVQLSLRREKTLLKISFWKRYEKPVPNKVHWRQWSPIKRAFLRLQNHFARKSKQELSRKKPLTQDGLIVEVKQKVRFLGIDCCLNGPLVALPSIPIADVPFNSLQKTRKTIYQVHRQTSWVIKVSWLSDNCLSWICSIEHIPANCFAFWTFILAIDWFCFFPCRKTICQRSSTHKLNDQGELTDR